MNDHICFSHYFMAKLSLKKYSTMYLKWLLSFKRRSQAIIHHELSATSFELEIICFVMRRLFIFCKVGIFLYHVSRMCKFSFCCKGREYVTKSRRYVRLTICVKKRKDMQNFFCLLKTLKVMNENEFWDQYFWIPMSLFKLWNRHKKWLTNGKGLFYKYCTRDYRKWFLNIQDHPLPNIFSKPQQQSQND